MRHYRHECRCCFLEANTSFAVSTYIQGAKIMRHRFGQLFHKLGLACGVLKWAVIFQLSQCAALLRNRQQIISSWPEQPVSLSSRVAVFMHFDRHGRVSAPAINYIEQLAANGFSVAFVTNSGKLAPTAQAALRKICVAIFVRRNTGYDFGAWRDVIKALDLPASDTKELIIANDSMYGPLRQLDRMLAQVDYAEADIWGLTESWQYRYHLQSFFLAFGEKALRSPAFGKFWNDVIPTPFKTFIVREYEVGFTQKMLKAGLKCRAIWRYEDLLSQVAGGEVLDGLARAERFKLARLDPLLSIRKLQITRIRGALARQIALNPTADLWRQLLLSGFPFIKRELLRKNPSRVEDIGDWVTVVRGELGLDPEPILSELRGALKNRAP